MRDESAFSLIELVVVILIVGLLAAIAIPTFLSQTSKANDAAAKAQARTAQTAAEELAVENNSSYATLSVSAAQAVEPTLRDTTGATFVAASSGSGEQGFQRHIAVAGRHHLHDSPRVGRHRDADMRPGAADLGERMYRRKVVTPGSTVRPTVLSHRSSTVDTGNARRNHRANAPGIWRRVNTPNRSREDPCFLSFVVTPRMRRVSP